MQTRLAQQRQHVQLLLAQIGAQGGLAEAKPATVCALSEARAELAATKARLCRLGVPVDDLPGDEHVPAEGRKRSATIINQVDGNDSRPKLGHLS